MTTVYFKSRDAASPWMVMISVFLHAAGILAIVAVSFSISNSVKQPELIIPVVTIKGPPPAPTLDKDTIQAGPAEAPPDLPVPEVLEAPPPPTEVAEVPRDTVEQTKLTSIKSEPVQLTKRKKPLRTLEADKPPEKPKEPVKKKETETKKEDPNAYMEKRLAAISKKVEEEKKNISSASHERRPKPLGPGNQRGGAGDDEELSVWVSDFKSRIRPHWSLIADWRQVKKKAKIRVQIADNGTLLNATVDLTSGDRVFDDSALRAVYQASPFPPAPPQVKARISQEGVILNFTSEGIQ
jgi:TonB family protein